MSNRISYETHTKIEANRLAGRLCAAGSHSHITRARVRITTEITSGPGVGQNGTMMLCRKHYNDTPLGYVGRNFVVCTAEVY